MAGIVIIGGGGASTASGPTRLRLRNRLADELGFYLPTAITAAASNGESARVVLADELRDDEAGYPFLGQWLYVRATTGLGDQQRRILNQDGVGYQGSKGAVVVSKQFDAALTTGRIVEVTSPLPVKRYVTIKGLHTCIDEGLALVRVRARLTLTGNGTYQVPLDDYPWITSEDQLIGVYDTMWDPSYAPTESPSPPMMTANGVSRTLITRYAYTTGDTFYVDVIVPADRIIFDGSTWSYVTTPGLPNDTSQAACSEQWAHVFAMVKALQQLQKMAVAQRGLQKDERGLMLADLAERRRQWEMAAVRIKTLEFPRPNHARVEPMVGTDALAAWR